MLVEVEASGMAPGEGELEDLEGNVHVGACVVKRLD